MLPAKTDNSRDSEIVFPPAMGADALLLATALTSTRLSSGRQFQEASDVARPSHPISLMLLKVSFLGGLETLESEQNMP